MLLNVLECNIQEKGHLNQLVWQHQDTLNLNGIANGSEKNKVEKLIMSESVYQLVYNTQMIKVFYKNYFSVVLYDYSYGTLSAQ